MHPTDRALIRGAAARGAQYVWWRRPPILVRLPPWWRWTVWLTTALVATYVANSHTAGLTWADWPPRLDAPTVAR